MGWEQTSLRHRLFALIDMRRCAGRERMGGAGKVAGPGGRLDQTRAQAHGASRGELFCRDGRGSARPSCETARAVWRVTGAERGAAGVGGRKIWARRQGRCVAAE
ncbi:hypothetical protein KCP70_13305 [Salmonella enterica subsp. enterica]|nr:hypothetical protein KCP70_13305 [Salmonella enterica subsp. enterica]